jgi:hypothetical protein
MFHSTRVLLLSTKRPRTIVRDPRKKTLPVAIASQPNQLQPQQHHHHHQQQQHGSQIQPLPFVPSAENQQSIGSSIVSYGLAGAGVAMGFALVGAIFGGH